MVQKPCAGTVPPVSPMVVVPTPVTDPPQSFASRVEKVRPERARREVVGEGDAGGREVAVEVVEREVERDGAARGHRVVGEGLLDGEVGDSDVECGARLAGGDEIREKIVRHVVEHAGAGAGHVDGDGAGGPDW